MGKTRAQYQKEYRERKKLQDKHYLKRERERTKKYKAPIAALSKEKQFEQREKNKLWKRISRERQRNKLSQIQTSEQENVVTNEIEKNVSPLKVKMNFNVQRRPRRRSKALRTANRIIHDLEQKLEKISRENRKLRKRNERFCKKLTSPKASTSKTCTDEHSDTPNSKAKRDIRNLGLTPKKVPRCVRKKLVMANAMLEEIKASGKKNTNQKRKRVVANIVSGNIIKKYKCLNLLSRETGMGRKTLKGVKSKNIETLARRRMAVQRESVKKLVIGFMERDDVSVNMPGKNDCKKIEKGEKGEKKQIRVLNDYLVNLYEKFKSENPNVKISQTVFKRLRPKHILLTKMISRNTCLCTKHQNFAMKLKALRSYGVELSANPETFSKNVSEEEMKVNIAAKLEYIDEVKYQEWKRLEVDGKKKMKIVDTNMNRNDFKAHMETQYKDFLDHVYRVKTQYSAIRTLKEKLPENEMLVHMDFAENFTCSYADEIQSAYWNATGVTLHPVVVYFRLGEDLEHKNYIYVSDVSSHNSSAVYTILKKLVPELKYVCPDLKVIHYWTDSPSSQYRNKYMIDIVQYHPELFNVAARWNYFESGHGKGPCDGLGGVAKRQAAEACKQGKVNIQDAVDFYQWASNHEKSIRYVFYSAAEYDATVTELENRKPKTVPGTMKLHAVFPIGNILYTASVSCYCETCLLGSPCENWIEVSRDKCSHDKVEPCARSNKRKCQSPEKVDNACKVIKTSNEEIETANNDVIRITQVDDTPAAGKYALVNWEGAIYPCHILTIDVIKMIADVSFMEEASAKAGCILFRWPNKPDIQNINISQIVRVIDEPSACSKSRRQFRLNPEDYEYLGYDSD